MPFGTVQSSPIGAVGTAEIVTSTGIGVSYTSVGEVQRHRRRRQGLACGSGRWPASASRPKAPAACRQSHPAGRSLEPAGQIFGAPRRSSLLATDFPDAGSPSTSTGEFRYAGFKQLTDNWQIRMYTTRAPSFYWASYVTPEDYHSYRHATPDFDRATLPISERGPTAAVRLIPH